MQYYFITSSLPDIQVGNPPDISFYDYITLLKENLQSSDYRQVEVIRRYYDIQNILCFWKDEELDPRGNLNSVMLEEALLTQTDLPDYVFSFLNRHETKEQCIKNFAKLIATYFHEEKKQANDFLLFYLNFEREWRLVLTGFRAKKLGRDLIKELQYEDPNDELTMQILAQKDAATFEPPSRYGDLKALFEQHEKAPLELHLALCEYRFQKIEEAYGVALFSLDHILAFLAQLIIVEKWLELDRKRGIEIVDQMIQEAS